MTYLEAFIFGAFLGGFSWIYTGYIASYIGPGIFKNPDYFANAVATSPIIAILSGLIGTLLVKG